MRIEHLAIWVEDLALMRAFYMQYFGASSNEKYVNPQKQFESYFLSFESGPRLELMVRPDIPSKNYDPLRQMQGLIHFAFELPNRAAVDHQLAVLKAAGIAPIDGPRVTGDGYYEFTILDPEENRIEVACIA